MTKTTFDTSAIKAVRTSRKPSAAQIAEKMEISESAVKKYFSGVLRVPEERRDALDKALDASVSWIAYDRANGVISPDVQLEMQREALLRGAMVTGMLVEAGKEAVTATRKWWDVRQEQEGLNNTIDITSPVVSQRTYMDTFQSPVQRIQSEQGESYDMVLRILTVAAVVGAGWLVLKSIAPE